MTDHVCPRCGAGHSSRPDPDYEDAAPAPAAEPYKYEDEDTCGVDGFAVAMKAKLADKRAEGKYGWDDPNVCSVPDLERMLHEHYAKGDIVDIANFCMMLHQRGAPSRWRLTPNAAPSAGAGDHYKSGNEFARYHPQASHVPPDYRDGWNHCYDEAATALARLREELRIQDQANDILTRRTAEAEAERDAAVARADKAQAVIDAALLWAMCPTAGGYKDGPAVEDTCEELGAAVNAYLGTDLQSPPDNWWTVEEMRAALDAAREGSAAKGSGNG